MNCPWHANKDKILVFITQIKIQLTFEPTPCAAKNLSANFDSPELNQITACQKTY